MLVAQFTRLFKSHAYRLFCFIVKIDGYNYKPRIVTQQCQCIVCGNDLAPEKELKMTKNKLQLAENSQIEELKASLVKASANISRLEYICNTQEHELKILSEKLVDYRGIKDVVKDIKDGLDELRINVNELQTKQEPSITPQRIDATLENRLNCLENFAKDVEDQDEYFKALEQDTDELKRELTMLKEMCERIELENRVERTTEDIPIWTISSDSMQRAMDSAYVSRDETITNMNDETNSDSSSYERVVKRTVMTIEANESSLAKELSNVSYTSLPDVVDHNVSCSSDCMSMKNTSKSSESLTHKQLLITDTYSDVSKEENYINFIENDDKSENVVDVEAASENIESSPEISDNPNLNSNSLDRDNVKVCISETSTAETLKCESSIDPWNDYDDEEPKDIDLNDYSCLYNFMYCWLSTCNHVFD